MDVTIYPATDEEVHSGYVGRQLREFNYGHVGEYPQAQYIRTIVGYPDADIHAAILRMPGDTGVFLEILEYRNVDKTPVDTRTANPGTAHLAFFTDDCDALYAELVAKGVSSVSAGVNRVRA